MDTLVTGENAGYQMPSTLDRHYVDRSSRNNGRLDPACDVVSFPGLLLAL